MATRGPRLEFAVGAFLLLALVSLLVLAIASTNGRFGFGFGSEQYELHARFTQIGQLRPNAPVKIGGVTIGRVSNIDLDLDPPPEQEQHKYTALVTLSIDARVNEITSDTFAHILTGGLLGESYISLVPGGNLDILEPGDEIVHSNDAVDLMQMVGKFMFNGSGADSGNASEPSHER